MSRPALLAAGLALCGCKDSVAEVILVLRTDMAQGSTLRGVHVVARRRGAARAVVDQRFTLPPTTLPGSTIAPTTPPTPHRWRSPSPPTWAAPGSETSPIA